MDEPTTEELLKAILAELREVRRAVLVIGGAKKQFVPSPISYGLREMIDRGRS
jgi:hypothetical protein